MKEIGDEAIVIFSRGQKAAILARIDYKVCFIHKDSERKREAETKLGMAWHVRIVGISAEGNAFFVRPVETVEERDKRHKKALASIEGRLKIALSEVAALLS